MKKMSKRWIFTFKNFIKAIWPGKDHSALCSRIKIDCDKRRKVFLIRTFFYQRPLLRWTIWGERRLEFQPQLFQQKLPLNIFSRLLKHLCESFPHLWTSPSKLLRYILYIRYTCSLPFNTFVYIFSRTSSPKKICYYDSRLQYWSSWSS